MKIKYLLLSLPVLLSPQLLANNVISAGFGQINSDESIEGYSDSKASGIYFEGELELGNNFIAHLKYRRESVDVKDSYNILPMGLISIGDQDVSVDVNATIDLEQTQREVGLYYRLNLHDKVQITSGVDYISGELSSSFSARLDGYKYSQSGVKNELSTSDIALIRAVTRVDISELKSVVEQNVNSRMDFSGFGVSASARYFISEDFSAVVGVKLERLTAEGFEDEEDIEDESNIYKIGVDYKLSKALSLNAHYEDRDEAAPRTSIGVSYYF